MPASLKALCAQLGGALSAYLLARSGLMPASLWTLAGAQAVSAAIIAALLRSARWWLPIHLAFLPLALLALRMELHPGWYLAAFLILALIYWSSFRTQVPLYLSNRATATALAALLPADRPARLLDIGAGTGTVLRHIAALRPDCVLTGVETAPGPWLLGRLLCRSPTISLRRADLFAHPWSDYDVIYAFLSPVPMPAVWHKAAQDMKAGALLVSNSFPVPEREPDFVVEVNDRRRTRLYCYRTPTAEAGK